MAKRRTEDTLLHDSPSKRCFRSLCRVDMQLESMAPAGGVNPPSLMALLGSRCRKRPYYFEDRERREEEGALFPKTAHCDTRKQAASVMTSGSFQEHRCSSAVTTCTKKRPRKDCTSSEGAIPKTNDKADGDTNTEACAYNSFQFWRVPLPELDLSLLEDDHSQTKEKPKVKDSSSDVMET